MARQSGISGELHSKVDNTIGFISKGLVSASVKLDSPPILDQVGSEEVQLQVWHAARDQTQDRESAEDQP